MLTVVDTYVCVVAEADCRLAFGLMADLLRVNGPHAHEDTNVALEVKNLVVEFLPLLHANFVPVLEHLALFSQTCSAVHNLLDLATKPLAHFQHLRTGPMLFIPQPFRCLNEWGNSSVKLCVQFLDLGQLFEAFHLSIPRPGNVTIQRLKLLCQCQALLFGRLDRLVLAVILRCRQFCFLLSLNLLKPIFKLLDALLQLLSPALGLGLLCG
mmetsp:Transcript_11282/g.26546  ORF Transcript_11282/g.26546 Transcript_11282/m.26546 type:complete len:211 (+) Transcript_11282:1000-1632(+)